jgi:CrcB protein
MILADLGKAILDGKAQTLLKELGWLAMAGAAGTVSRYAIAGIVQKFSGAGFPWGTLVVNAVGCLLFGLIATLAEERLLISGQTRFIILTGFLGAFTTFSTFAFESGQLLRDAEWALAAANLVAQNVLGLACIFLGIMAGRLL